MIGGDPIWVARAFRALANACRIRDACDAREQTCSSIGESAFCGTQKAARETHALPRRRASFTIIELLVVMAVIVVLAGLILGTSGYVQKKGARSRAEAEIAAISAACESYKADNGTYPRTSETDGLDPTNTSSTVYVTASLKLYEQLSGDADDDRKADTKSYFAFKPNQLYPADGASNVQYIRDPFGNSYGYSTMKASGGANGYNPTFDLWSTAGSTDPNQWIKNW